MNYEELYKEYLKSQLEKLTDHPIEIYTELEWQQGTEIDSGTICIVLQRLPSANYGETSIQQLNVIVECSQKLQVEVMTMLNTYQALAYNTRHYIENILVTETYQTPYVSRPFNDVETTWGMEITMNGTVTFSNNANDIKSIKVYNEEINYIEVREILSCETPSQPTIDSPTRARAVTKTSSYQLQIRLLNTTKNTCMRIRNYMHGKGDDTLKITIEYIDGEIYTETYIYSSSAISYANGSLSVYDIALTLKKED